MSMRLPILPDPDISKSKSIRGVGSSRGFSIFCGCVARAFVPITFFVPALATVFSFRILAAFVDATGIISHGRWRTLAATFLRLNKRTGEHLGVASFILALTLQRSCPT
jgi:hypothetical protein